MQIAEIIKLKLDCLELATKNSSEKNISSLEIAKSYYNWVTKEHNDLMAKSNQQPTEE